MDRTVPNFQTRVRGLDAAQVTDYILQVHGEIASLHEQVQRLQRDAGDAEAERQRLNNQIGQLHGQIGQLQSEVDRLSGPIDSVEGMSDRIARMMRIASDEAHRTKALAREEAAELTRELHDEIEAARQDRAAANAALAEFEASAAARREQILSEAKAEAEHVVQAAHAERARLTEETEENERRLRARLTQELEETERRRREAQRELAEEDARRRRENQRRLDEQLKSSWEQASAQIAAYEQEGRVKAAGIISAAERDAQLLKERTEEQVKELIKVRGDVLAALSDIQNRIETAVRRDRITVVKTAAAGDEA